MAVNMRVKYDVVPRRKADELFSRGLGYKAVSTELELTHKRKREVVPVERPRDCHAKDIPHAHHRQAEGRGIARHIGLRFPRSVATRGDTRLPTRLGVDVRRLVRDGHVIPSIPARKLTYGISIGISIC